jgi:hypothetical protein
MMITKSCEQVSTTTLISSNIVLGNTIVDIVDHAANQALLSSNCLLVSSAVDAAAEEDASIAPGS